MNYFDHTRHMKRYDAIKSALVAAQQQRGMFPSIEWMEYERLTVLWATNRAGSTMDPSKTVTLEQIKACEQQASGHVDYTKKFALYAAELLLENTNDTDRY